MALSATGGTGTGSSPRTWGTLTATCGCRVHGRFIPTDVGNTASIRTCKSRTAVHPHGRGEHSRKQKPSWPPTGSSPRTWGTHPLQRRLHARRRFIPTDVGNTSVHNNCYHPQPVHPHGRGEHVTVGGVSATGIGSSPRTWGTRVNSRCLARRRRFIPTDVGNTSTVCRTRAAVPVHPHGRGEHTGSNVSVIDTQRFIPTDVGNTRPRRCSCCAFTVHPHGRGEHAARSASLSIVIGSSPRTWGTLVLQTFETARCRFIPTDVGNTVRIQRAGVELPGSSPRTWGTLGVQIPQIFDNAVHPHGRGEHWWHLPHPLLTFGSSPRTWGTLPPCALETL